MRKALAAVVLAALAAPANAAAEDVIARAPMGEAVAFAGDEIAYEERYYRARGAEAERWWTRVVRRAPGGRRRVVATLPRQFSDPG